MNNVSNGMSNLYFVEEGLCLMSVLYVKVKKFCKYVNRNTSLLCFLYFMKVIALKLYYNLNFVPSHFTADNIIFPFTFDFSRTIEWPRIC